LLTNIERSKVRHETSLLLVDFNLGENLRDKNDGKRIERTVSCVSILILELRSHFYQGTPIFISRAVERGKPVPHTESYKVPAVPKIPECYANAHPKRNDDFPEEAALPVDPPEQENQSQDDTWRHELDHDVESVFWLLLYWAMVAKPKATQGEKKGKLSQEASNIPTGTNEDEGINVSYWSLMLGDFMDRERLVSSLRTGDMPNNLIHLVYKPLWPLIRSLAAILVVDRLWIPEPNVRKDPEYTCEAFQRLILQFIVSKRSEIFMNCPVSDKLRQVQGVALSQALSTTPSLRMDGSEREREVKRRRMSY
jgi:hypothetical protein